MKQIRTLTLFLPKRKKKIRVGNFKFATYLRFTCVTTCYLLLLVRYMYTNHHFFSIDERQDGLLDVSQVSCCLNPSLFIHIMDKGKKKGALQRCCLVRTSQQAKATQQQQKVASPRPPRFPSWPQAQRLRDASTIPPRIRSHRQKCPRQPDQLRTPCCWDCRRYQHRLHLGIERVASRYYR